MADLDASKRHSESLRILGKRPRRAPMDRSGELIEDDDQREPRSWPLRPMVELSSRSALQQVSEGLDDRCVRVAAKRPFELPDYDRMIIAQMRAEPEPENIFEFFAGYS